MKQLSNIIQRILFKKKLNYEESFIESQKKLAAPLETEKLAKFNDMILSAGSTQMQSNKMYEYHKLFKTKRGYPDNINVDDCYQLLWNAYETGRSVEFMNMSLLKNDNILTERPDYILNRIRTNSTNRINWYLKSKPRDIDPHYMNPNIKYDPSKFHSFSNCTDTPLIIQHGKTHIFVGFCDLSQLTKCSFLGESAIPTRFVCVDMSLYSVAKSVVIYEMLKDQSITAESILEVWYSSVWTKNTRIHFKRVVEKIINDDDRIIQFDEKIFECIKHWHNSAGVSVEYAHRLWFNSLTKTYSEIGTFHKLQDTLDYAEYVISGHFIRTNIVMFDNLREIPKKAKDENLYHVIEINQRFLNFWKEKKSLKAAARTCLLTDIKRLKQLISEQKVVLEFILDEVNKHLMNTLQQMNPYSVSWSNCIDSVPAAQFHSTAKEIGCIDCVHYAYSMNWVCSMKGTHIIDYPSNFRMELFIASNNMIQEYWKMHGMQELFIYPPMSNIINFGSESSLAIMYREWVYWFLSKKTAKTEIQYNPQNIIRNMYNPFHSTNTVINFCWTYD
eukprot:517316_1